MAVGLMMKGTAHPRGTSATLDGAASRRPASAQELELALYPGRVSVSLCAIFMLLLLAHALTLYLEFGLGYSYALGFVPLFNIGLEGNVPTFFATALLILNGLLFLLVSRLSGWRRWQSRGWLVLAAAFFFVGVDEFAMIHERLIEPVRALLGTGGLLYFAWVIPYAVLALALGGISLPLILGLGPGFAARFGAAAATFLGGAIGVEMLGGRYFEARGEAIDLTYRLYQTLEESLEFTGLLILVHTLLTLLARRASSLHVALRLRPR